MSEVDYINAIKSTIAKITSEYKSNAEVLATTIGNNNEVEGITVGSTAECKLSQYADDTTLILDGTQKSLECSFVI